MLVGEFCVREKIISWNDATENGLPGYQPRVAFPARVRH